MVYICIDLHELESIPSIHFEKNGTHWRNKRKMQTAVNKLLLRSPDVKAWQVHGCLTLPVWFGFAHAYFSGHITGLV